MRTLLIRLNNWVTRRRGVRVAPRHLLLLVPHCLQNSECERNVSSNIERCERCGRCDAAGLLRLRDRYGVRCSMVGGGRQALRCVRGPDVKAVVAVACERELLDGIRASFPKPVCAVPNLRPAGPCRDTRVDLERVEESLRSMLDPASLPPGR